MVNYLAQTKLEDVPGATENGVATIKGLEVIFSNVVTIAIALAGIALFIMLISGGFKFLTAGGDKQGVEGAKQTLTYALIGFVVIISAFLILQFIKEFTGVDVTIFKVTQ
ncbi:hypothetical protein HY404_02510 [Candidatus Microgenomates bacterium]|nr:hypothetical protein [Candidatus Microgenomates bacterium]